MDVKEFAEVREWYNNQFSACPPRPVVPEHAEFIKCTMENNIDFWRCLGGGREMVWHEPYHERVLEMCSYLCLFGATRDSWARHDPAICYGVTNHRVPSFATWIEFKYRSDTIWTLYECYDSEPGIAQVPDRDLENRPLIYRSALHFDYSWMIAANNNESC